MKTGERHIPCRMCIVCRSHGPKGDLLRFFMDERGCLQHDEGQRKMARGYYVCRNLDCLSRIVGESRKMRRRNFRLAQKSLDELRRKIENLKFYVTK